LNTELDANLTEERTVPADEGANQSANRRNGGSPKTVTMDSGKMVLDIPRDRNGSFDPVLIAKLLIVRCPRYRSHDPNFLPPCQI
jgi:putative transposase